MSARPASGALGFLVADDSGCCGCTICHYLVLFSSLFFVFFFASEFCWPRAEVIGVHCVSMRVYPDADQGAVLGKAAWPV